MKAINDINDPRLVKALAHPLRVRILGVLQDRVASPSDLAEELNAPLGNVSYHVRILAQLGLLKLVKKRPRRARMYPGLLPRLQQLLLVGAQSTC